MRCQPKGRMRRATGRKKTYHAEERERSEGDGGRQLALLDLQEEEEADESDKHRRDRPEEREKDLQSREAPAAGQKMKAELQSRLSLTLLMRSRMTTLSSTLRASMTRFDHWRSQAKALMYLMAPMSSFCEWTVACWFRRGGTGRNATGEMTHHNVHARVAGGQKILLDDNRAR